MNTEREALKPCPLCGGPAELDTRQGYTYLKHGQHRHGTAVAVYCTECTVQISVCVEDVPDITPEAVIEMWNRRHAAAELVSASLVAPQEVRMLTGTEMDDCECATYPRTVRAIVLKCAEIWGLSIKEQAVKPATEQEKH